MWIERYYNAIPIQRIHPFENASKYHLIEQWAFFFFFNYTQAIGWASLNAPESPNKESLIFSSHNALQPTCMRWRCGAPPLEQSRLAKGPLFLHLWTWPLNPWTWLANMSFLCSLKELRGEPKDGRVYALIWWTLTTNGQHTHYC